MKRSVCIQLLASTSLLASLPGCSGRNWGGDANSQRLIAGGGDSTVFDPNRDYPDNTYIPTIGYYHAAAHWWYPNPVNYYDPLQGYFFGGAWYREPQIVVIHVSRPDPSRSYAYFSSRSTRSVFAGSHEAAPAHAGSGSHSGAGISRGGFGASGHASGGS